jgi:tetratricopeptide (TPR) repeat protein
MSSKIPLWTGLIGIGAIIALVQPIVKAAPIPANTAPKADDYFALAAQKYEKQDYQGSLADYNRAISLDPNNALAYGSRGLLKANKLNDRSGGVADLQKAARLFQQQGDTMLYEQVIDALKKIEGQNS